MNEMAELAIHTVEHGQWWPSSWLGRFWIMFGFGAQLTFTARFLVQWIASERMRESYMPTAFWYLSIVGAIMLFAYAVVWKHDPVVALGQTMGAFVYVRNLVLMHRARARETVVSRPECSVL